LCLLGRSNTFLSGVPLRVLEEVGLSAPSGQRLRSLGWRYVGELRYLSKHQLAELFPEAQLLLRYAQAADKHPIGYWTPPPTISAQFDFGEPAIEAFELDAALELLVARLHEQLAGRHAHNVTITAMTQYDEVQRHRFFREPLSNRARTSCRCSGVAARTPPLFASTSTASATAGVTLRRIGAASSGARLTFRDAPTLETCCAPGGKALFSCGVARCVEQAEPAA
jgi:hypothetical protein